MQPLTPPPRSGSCFQCNKPGHWARDCPLKSATISNRYPLIQCQCGHGFCEIKTCKNGINKGRQYYLCPIPRGKKCSFLWCDEATRERIDAPAPPYKYPECSSCFGGVCRREKETKGPNAGRYYFACPIKPGHGSCGFVTWEHEVHQGGQRTLEFMAETSQVHETADEDLREGAALHLESFKRMKIMDGEFTAAMVAAMEKGEHDETTELSTPTNSFSFPHLEIDDDLSDEVLSSVPLEEIIENNPLKRSRVTSRSAVRRLDVEFDEQNPDVPDSPLAIILSSDGCSVPDMMDASPCSDIEKLEQPTSSNEATPSQEEFRQLKLEIKGLKEVVTVLASLMPPHLSNVPINGVLSAAVQEAPVPPALQMHGSHLS